jgi:hypothetical protein
MPAALPLAVALSLLAGEPAPRCREPCVLVVIAADSTLDDAVADHLAAVGVAVEPDALATPASPAEQLDAADARADARGALALLWIDPLEDAIRIRLVDARAGALYERGVVRGETDATTSEAVAVVVRRAVEDLLAGSEPEGLDRVAIERAPPRASVAAPPRPSPPHRRWRLRVGAAYSGEAWARERAWQSGMAAELGFLAPFGLHVALGYRVLAPARVDDDAASLRVGRHPIELGIGWSLRRGLLAVDARVVAVVDVLAARVRPERAGVVGRDSVRADGGVAARFGAGVRALPWLVVGAAVALEVWPAAFSWAVEDEGDTRVLLTPRKVRPHVLVGLVFEPEVGRPKKNPGRPGERATPARRSGVK